MNYPYEFLLKRIANAEKIDFTEFLAGCGYATDKEMEDLINRFDNNADAIDKINPFLNISR